MNYYSNKNYYNEIEWIIKKNYYNEIEWIIKKNYYNEIEWIIKKNYYNEIEWIIIKKRNYYILIFFLFLFFLDYEEDILSLLYLLYIKKSIKIKYWVTM